VGAGRWLLLWAGAAAVALGFAVLPLLTARPEQAGWLTPAERGWLAGEVGREEESRRRHHGLTLGRALAPPRVLLLILLYFTAAAGSNAFGSYLPALIKERVRG